MKFLGFFRGTRYTPVPDPLFNSLLEAIEDLAEIKCTLRALWLISDRRRKGYTQYVASAELLSDRVLLAGLEGLDASPAETIRRGVTKAVERGTFLSLPVNLSPSAPPYQETKSPQSPLSQRGVRGDLEQLYFLNDEEGRRARATIEKGIISIQGFTLREGLVGEVPEPKPDIFTLYEDNIGLLTYSRAEELKDIEQNYPWPWVQEAFKTAIDHGVRDLRYIKGILRRWETERKDDGEPGRHPPKISSREDFKEYLRRRGRLLEP